MAGCRKLHEWLHDLCSSPSIIRTVKSRRLTLTGPAARMGGGGGRTHIGYSWKSHKERDN
jgi:hypothetical protein